MVQVVENWAVLEGRVLTTRSSHVGPDYLDVDVEVERVEPVADFPNLLSEAEHTVIPVTMSRAVVERLGLKAGGRIRCRARKASPFAVFAKPDDVNIADTD